MTSVDVAIAGGGPGGAAAAIALARQGQRVLLADAGTGRWPRIGEGLPPSARALLRELGVLDQVLAEGHRRSPGTLAFWGSNTAHTEDSLFGLHGDGLQLDPQVRQLPPEICPTAGVPRRENNGLPTKFDGFALCHAKLFEVLFRAS